MLKDHLDYEISNSPIIGRGIIALRLIKSGETIFEWHPIIITKEEAKLIPVDEFKHYTYPSGDRILWMQPPERYINHSCGANTVVVGQSDVASRDIHVGEEITSDYMDIETEYFVCKCGTQKCRGSSRYQAPLGT